MWGRLSPPKPRGTTRTYRVLLLKTGRSLHPTREYITGTVRAFHEEARAAIGIQQHWTEVSKTLRDGAAPSCRALVNRYQAGILLTAPPGWRGSSDAEWGS